MRLRGLAFAAMMAGLAALLQTGPVWLSEPAGYVLSILAALPPAVAAAAYPREALWAAAVAVLLCLLVNPQEAVVFGLTNGLLGLALGLTAGMPPLRSALLAGAALLGGMVVLTWGVGVAALGEAVLQRGAAVALGVYAGFALLWAGLFTAIFRAVWRRLLRSAPGRGSRSLPSPACTPATGADPSASGAGSDP